MTIETVRNIKLTLEYDGSRFFGFQTQRGQRTVQSELETALGKLFQRKIKVIASARTDSGVHAEGQVVNFNVDSKLPRRNILRGLNAYLPEDISVLEVSDVPPSFHAQHSAKRKIYEYRVLNSSSRSPLVRSQSLWFPHRLNITQMKRAARFLRGPHDFRVFEASGGRRRSAVRTLRTFSVRKSGKMIRFRVEANGFLYKMVRSMVGTLLEIGTGKLQLEDVAKAMKSKNRKGIGPTVGPQGLVLKQVVYYSPQGR